MSTHLAAHHSIGKFYKCLFYDYEMYDKRRLVKDIIRDHKDKPKYIVIADSFPFVIRSS